MKNIRVGDVVECQFYDHSEGTAGVEPIFTVLHGKIHKIADKYIEICSWDTPEDDDSNYKSFAILISCIEKLIVWTEGDVRFDRSDMTKGI